MKTSINPFNLVIRSNVRILKFGLTSNSSSNFSAQSFHSNRIISSQIQPKSFLVTPSLWPKQSKVYLLYQKFSSSALFLNKKWNYSRNFHSSLQMKNDPNDPRFSEELMKNLENLRLDNISDKELEEGLDEDSQELLKSFGDHEELDLKEMGLSFEDLQKDIGVSPDILRNHFKQSLNQGMKGDFTTDPKTRQIFEELSQEADVIGNEDQMVKLDFKKKLILSFVFYFYF